MKFGFLTVAASALLVSLVLGKPMKGLRKGKKTKVRVALSHFAYDFLCILAHLIVTVPFFHTGRAKPCRSSASQTL